jgi:hypothetical protein
MVGDTKLFAERQNQSAKPFRLWSETIVIILNNNEIRRRSILPMAKETLPMVEETLPMVKETLPMVGSISTLVKIVSTMIGIVLSIVGDAQPMVEDMKLLAKRQMQWSET